MSYKISIIIPIFNVEKYLYAALDSIVAQTFDLNNLEVLMIDDCSTDNSGTIIDEYSEKYENFIAIHLDNNSGTAGKPRNVGLDNARGDYIMFLDSDDELMEDVCEVLYSKLIETNADIVTGNAICIQPDKEVMDIIYPEKYYEFSPNKNLKIFKPFRLWGTLYKKSLIEDTKKRFIRASTNDDTHFVYNCYLAAKKIVYINDYFGVKYYERDADEFQSLTHKITKFNLITTFDAFINIVNLIKVNNVSEDYYYDPFLTNIYARFAFYWDMNNDDKKEIFLKILEYEDSSDYVKNLHVQFKIMDWFLNRKLFNLLIYIQKLYAWFVGSRFSKKFLLPRLPRNKVD